MREIKFRGMSEITGHEWVYGNLHIDYKSGDMWVGEEAPYEPIVRETVGQYTGFKDCNGTEIYEGDILAYTVLDTKYEWEVVWSGDSYRCIAENLPSQSLGVFSVLNSDAKVIGNIYEKG